MRAIKNILCPVDLSDISQHALDHAVGLARCYGSTVTAMHVVSAAPLAFAAPYYPELAIAPPVVLPAARVAAVAALERLVLAEAVPGVRVEVVVAEGPQVYREILLQADRLSSELIVMGTHGRSGFERLLLGSTTEKVLRKSRHPVMTVPPGAPDAMPRGPAPFARILCAVDFSETSQVAVGYAVSLAHKGRGALTLLHVIESIPDYYGFTPAPVLDLGAWTRQAEERLRLMTPDTALTSCFVRHLVAAGTPHREILAVAKEHGCDLIVMGVQGRNAVDLLFFGSTTHHIIREAQCAVLTVRPR